MYASLIMITDSSGSCSGGRVDKEQGGNAGNSTAGCCVTAMQITVLSFSVMLLCKAFINVRRLK